METRFLTLAARLKYGNFQGTDARNPPGARIGPRQAASTESGVDTLSEAASPRPIQPAESSAVSMSIFGLISTLAPVARTP